MDAPEDEPKRYTHLNPMNEFGVWHLFLVGHAGYPDEYVYTMFDNKEIDMPLRSDLDHYQNERQRVINQKLILDDKDVTVATNLDDTKVVIITDDYPFIAMDFEGVELLIAALYTVRRSLRDGR